MYALGTGLQFLFSISKSFTISGFTIKGFYRRTGHGVMWLGLTHACTFQKHGLPKHTKCYAITVATWTAKGCSIWKSVYFSAKASRKMKKASQAFHCVMLLNGRWEFVYPYRESVNEAELLLTSPSVPEGLPGSILDHDFMWELPELVMKSTFTQK